MRSSSRSVLPLPATAAVVTIAWMGLTLAGGCDKQPTDASGPVPTATTPSEPTTTPPIPPVASGPPATSPSDADDSTDAAPPHVTFERTLHDFGRILDVEVHETSFLFTSDGEEPLVIEKITNSPGCIVLEPAEGDIFVSGDMGMVRVRFEPMSYGKHQKFVHVITNGKPSGFTRLTLAADVEALVSPTPRYVELGGLDLGKEHRTTVALTCSRGPFEVVTVNTTSPNLTATITDAATVPPGAIAAKSLEIVIDEKAPWGTFGSWVEITSKVTVPEREQPLRHFLRIPVQAALIADLVPQPLAMRIITNTGDVWKGTTRLSHRGGGSFEIISTSVEGETFSGAQVTVEPHEEGGFVITLSSVAPGEPGNYSGRLLIKTDVEGEIDLTVPILMQARGSADG